MELRLIRTRLYILGYVINLSIQALIGAKPSLPSKFFDGISPLKVSTKAPARTRLWHFSRKSSLSLILDTDAIFPAVLLAGISLKIGYGYLTVMGSTVFGS